MLIIAYGTGRVNRKFQKNPTFFVFRLQGRLDMKVMAIDLGDARTGIAVSDAMGWLTGFTTVIHSWDNTATVG